MINNRFNLDKVIGKGRSSVFLCDDSQIPGKKFALKVLPGKSSEEEINSFRDEFFLLKKLNHPNIIAAYEYGTILTITNKAREEGIKTGDKFILLEYFESSELSEIYTPEENILKSILIQVSSVLYYLHQSNYIYFDLKPENILVNFIDEQPSIKFIDFGFAKHIPSTAEFVSRGTKEYMSPEIIKKEPVDHRADLYSLGILLYRMIYEKLPFDTDKELQIYKSHISGVFEFKETDYTIPIESAIQKLLRKNPSDRYYTTVQLLSDLDIDYTIVKKDWNFIPAFSGRADVLQKLKKYLASNTEGSIYVLTGPEGIGKTEVLNFIEQSHTDVITIKTSQYSSGADFAVQLINTIVYQDFVFKKLDESLVQYITLHIKPDAKDLIGQVKSIISKISGQIGFSLLIDDLGKFDQFALEVLQNLLPILQSNGIHIITTENSNSHYAKDHFNNYTEIKLPVFSEENLESFIDASFAAFFPKDKLLQLISEFIETNPGEIVKFISHLIFLKIIDYKFEGPEINYSDEEKQGLVNSFKEIYKEILADCSFAELQYLKTIVALQDSYHDSFIDTISDADAYESKSLSEQLRSKNILQNSVRSINLAFTSLAFRDYVYDLIKEKAEFHRNLALKLKDLNDNKYNSEIAYQFEMSGDFRSSYIYYNKLIDHARELSALGTQRYLLEKVLQFELPIENHNSITVQLANVLAEMGDFKSCLELTEKAFNNKLEPEQYNILKFRKAFGLSNTGDLEKAKEILESFKDDNIGSDYFFDIRIELARIELKLNNDDKTRHYCESIIGDSRANDFYKGQASNILGLVAIYKENNQTKALKYFDETLNYYEKANNMVQIAAIELNIGNIYSMLQNDMEAKKHWNRALQINQSIGNVEQEANILMNTGIFFFNKNDYEKAIENYFRSLSIFQGTGNKFGKGLVYSNLGEAHLQMCEYGNSMHELETAAKIFSELKVIEELAEVLLYQSKLFYSLNSFEELKKIFDKLEAITEMEENPRGQRIRSMSRLLFNLLSQINPDSEEIDKLIEYFHEQEDKNSTIILIDIKIQFLRKKDDFVAISEYLVSNHLEDLFNTKITSAWKNYFLALITSKYSELTKENEIFYLNNAFNLIEEESITELTKKVLISLMEYYAKRGNTSKANLYSQYFNSLFTHIEENIPNKLLRNSYSQSAEMQKALSLVESLPSN